MEKDDEEEEQPKMPLRRRVLLFLLFASLSYGAYYLLSDNPLGYRFHFSAPAEPAASAGARPSPSRGGG